MFAVGYLYIAIAVFGVVYAALHFVNHSRTGRAWRSLREDPLAAEAMDHHSEWTNVYNRVEITLTTHSSGGVTALDLALARSIDRLADAASHG